MSYLKNITALPPSKYTPGATHTIPARSGVAVPLPLNHRITITNTHGTQVVDTWFLSTATPSTPASHVSMCHTRAHNLRLSPRVGDTLVSNHRAGMVVLEQDSAAEVGDVGVGVHDTLIAACDAARYRGLGVEGFHDSCAENFRRALRADLGVEVGDDVSPPDPLNLWMNIPVTPNEGVGVVKAEGMVRNWSVGAEITFERPVCRKGDWVVVRALVEGVVVVMSACPQDILKINELMPVDAAFRVDGP